MNIKRSSEIASGENALAQQYKYQQCDYTFNLSEKQNCFVVVAAMYLV